VSVLEERKGVCANKRSRGCENQMNDLRHEFRFSHDVSGVFNFYAHETSGFRLDIVA
jgi:hypothetical protein